MENSKREMAPPTPEVQYLPAVFRRIESGEIRIPAFQRDFVWNERQIIELLESVYKGYPIGSVLFWKVDEQVLQIEQNDNIPFPVVEERYPISFILDGMQRLSSLYGVFHHKSDSKAASTFNVLFDLETQRFRHLDSKEGVPQQCIPLTALFSPRQLLEVQRVLTGREDGDLLIDRSIKLYSVFQEYLIPTVTISLRDVPEVVEIFERINSTGTVLGAVDFMRAMTWSADFDLGKEISRLQDGLNQERFEFPAETLVKALAVVMDKAPTSAEMITLKFLSADELHAAVTRTHEALVLVINFLKESFRIFSYDYVPYEGQFLVLVKLFALVPAPSEEVLSLARSWFWSISFSEALRGRSDSYIARQINNVKRVAAGDTKALDFRLDLSEEDLAERRLISGRALSAASVSMMAVKEVRSLKPFSTEVIAAVFEPALGVLLGDAVEAVSDGLVKGVS